MPTPQQPSTQRTIGVDHLTDQAAREEILRNNLTCAGFSIDDLSPLIDEWRVREQKSTVSSRVRAEHLKLLDTFIKEQLTTPRGPILLEGVNPPWILEALLNAPPPAHIPKFRQRILVLQHDWFEFFDGLACADLGQELASPRIEWFVGEDASSRLQGWCEDRIDDAPPAFVMQNPLLQVTKTGEDAKSHMRTIEERWSANETSLIQRIKSRPKRDATWWAQRYRSPMPSGEPLRVLIPVALNTTYLRHIAADICDTLQSKGMRAQILIEQDESTVMSQSSILRSICDFDPDLIVSVNYTRRSLGQHVPEDIPHLCWIQDAMDHLYTSESGRACGPRDFVVGMIKPELIKLYNYPDERTRFMPMVASQLKFSPNKRVTRFESEIAWVTHQSEHPDQMRDRLLRELGAQSNASFINLFREVEQCVQTTMRENLHPQLNTILDQCIFPNGVPEQANSVRSQVLNSMVLPYAERVLRHQTAQWAANIAERNGWRLKLYGHGWEQHPTLSAYACGPLDHDNALRDAYQSSLVHLHASIYQATHQRVTECTLSGGLTLCRTIRSSFSGALKLITSIADRTPQAGSLSDNADQPPVWDILLSSSELGSKLISEMRRLGHCRDTDFLNDTMRRTQASLETAHTFMRDEAARQNAEMFLSLTDLCFSSESQLESLIDRAVNDQDWRSDRIEQARRDLPRSLTTDGFIDAVLELISESLSEQPDS